MCAASLLALEPADAPEVWRQGSGSLPALPRTLSHPRRRGRRIGGGELRRVCGGAGGDGDRHLPSKTPGRLERRMKRRPRIYVPGRLGGVCVVAGRRDVRRRLPGRAIRKSHCLPNSGQCGQFVAWCSGSGGWSVRRPPKAIVFSRGPLSIQDFRMLSVMSSRCNSTRRKYSSGQRFLSHHFSDNRTKSSRTAPSGR